MKMKTQYTKFMECSKSNAEDYLQMPVLIGLGFTLAPRIQET